MINELSIEYINNRISQEFCEKTIDMLKDEQLMEMYMNSNSVKIAVKTLKNILEKNEVETYKINLIINEYILELIPPGTKGVIRGNKFNLIIKEHIVNLQLSDLFEIKFECNIPTHLYSSYDIQEISEIPDWYILEKSTNKILIGMNQLDLWEGGHQTNRAFKYLNYNNNDQVKLVCVVCNKIKITDRKTKGEKNKKYKIFNIGFLNNTLCYIKGLETIIKEFFGLISF